MFKLVKLLVVVTVAAGVLVLKQQQQQQQKLVGWVTGAGEGLGRLHVSPLHQS
jgi:hypothetical protein